MFCATCTPQTEIEDRSYFTAKRVGDSTPLAFAAGCPDARFTWRNADKPRVGLSIQKCRRVRRGSRLENVPRTLQDRAKN